MGVPKKISESHWGTYFIWPFRCSGFLGGSRISSKMVSLHFPGENHSFGNRSNELAGYRLQAKQLMYNQGLEPVTVWKASSSMSSPPELAELLYWARALLYSWSVPFISSTALGSGRREGGRRKGSLKRGGEGGWAVEMKVEFMRFAEDSSYATDLGKKGNLQPYKSNANARTARNSAFVFV